MPAIWSMCGFSVSIHSRSAPFCSEVMQSSTQRSSPVPARNWKRLLGQALRTQQLAVAVDDDVAVAPASSAVISSQSRKLLYWSPRSPGSWLTAICLVRPAPSESVRVTMTPSVDAQLEEGVAAGADLGEEVLVRHRDLAVLVAALLLVGDLVLDLQAQAPASIIFLASR